MWTDNKHEWIIIILEQSHLVSFGICDNVNFNQNIDIIIITKDNRKSYHDYLVQPPLFCEALIINLLT